MPIDLANLSRVFRRIAGDFDWLPPHCRMPPEIRGSSALGEGIKHERFVSAACQALRDAAEHSVRQAKEKEQSPSAGRRYAKEHHFYHHSDCGGDDERSTSDPIREYAGWQVRANNGYRPRKIQQGILRRAEAEVEEQHRQDWVIEPRVEEHTEKDKAPPVAIGGIAGIGSTHASRAILSAFASVAIAYRNPLVAFTVAVLAALLPFGGVAYSQEPAHLPTPARTRLVVGLTQSPPFCIRARTVPGAA